MEDELKSFDFSKPKSRKCWQSIQKIFGLPEEANEEDEIDSLNDKEFEILENKKLFSLEKLYVNNAAELLEEKEALKSKKAKKTEGQPAAIKTFCRIRPTDNKNENFKVKESDSGFLLVNMDPVTLRKFNGISSFTFSKIFDEKSTQKEVFDETCLTLIQEIFQKRKSGLIFTYGMTNAGKTFTVVGSKEQPGILPQSLSYLYEKIDRGEKGINKFKVFCNFIEIYNEEVFDLLANDAKNPKFKRKVNIKEKEKKFFVQDPTYCEINKLQDFNAALNKGITKKVQCSNNINQNSSRSHTIFRIILKTSLADEEEITLSIVDLAGSERANRTEAQGKELQEACKINQSLSVLGKCMEALKHNSIFINKKIVPFRESKLTMLFQEYFSGDQNIIMITNINPRKEDFEETMRALNYSCIAKEIKKAKIVVQPIKKLVKQDETNNSIANASTALDAESILNLTVKNNFLFDENNKTAIKNSIITEDQTVNPFKIDSDNRMSNSEFSIFRDDLLKIKAQLEILTSNNSSNKIIQNQTYPPCYPPYMNNFYTGFPNANINNINNSNNNPFFAKQPNDKEQATYIIGNNNNNINYLDDTSEENFNEANNLNKNTAAGLNNINKNNNENKNANIFNNFFSSNGAQHAMNFMHQGFPFPFPSSFQPFPFLNPASAFNQSFNFKEKQQNNNEQNNLIAAAENDKNNILLNEGFDMDSSISSMENFCENNFNQNKNKNNKVEIQKDSAINRPNYDLNVPSSVNTFNMIFINTKINDVNLGYKGRTYRRKNNLATINETKDEENAEASAANAKKNENNKKQKEKTIKENKAKSAAQDKKKDEKAGPAKRKKADKKDKDQNQQRGKKNKNVNDSLYLARYAMILNEAGESTDRTNGRQESNDRVNGKAQKGDNLSEVSLDSLFN